VLSKVKERMFDDPPTRQSRRRAASLLACVLALLSVAVAGLCPDLAHGDGDPASDVLLAQDVFYPYQPKVSPGLEAALEKTLHTAASTAGLHLKVAIIGTAEELGLVPNFFGHPQPYAQFLDREISFNHPQQLLVVMPAGFGVMPASLANGLARVRVENQQRSNGLTHSAILAVVALARSQGHPIAAPATSSSSSSSSPPALLVFGLPAALLVLVGLAMTRRRRSRFVDHQSRNDEA
jgi:MYXO-CTERM domain-containing protein